MINIHQSKTPEKVSSKIISKLYNIVKENESDNNSDIFGYIQSTYGYLNECTYLKNKYSNFDIDILGEYYKEFVDENCKKFFAICPAGDGNGITVSSWNRLTFSWGDRNTTYGITANPNYFGTTRESVSNNKEGALIHKELLVSIEYFPEIIDLNAGDSEINSYYSPIFLALSGLKEINIPRTCNLVNFAYIKNNNLEIIDMSNIDYYSSIKIDMGGLITPNLKKIILAPPISMVGHGSFAATTDSSKEGVNFFFYTKEMYNDTDSSTWTYNGLRNATFWVQDSAYEDFLTHRQIKPKLGTNITLKKFSEYTGNDLVQKWISDNHNPMDILYENSKGELFVRSEVVNPSEGLTPIALCIAGTGFFGPNEPARWISLKYMSYETPDSGVIPPSIYGTSDMSMLPAVGKDIQDIINYYYKFKNSTGNESYLTTPYQTKTENLIPSVFDNDNNWNTNELGNKNEYAITDINGKTSNKIVLELLKNSTIQPNWKTDDTISTTISNNDEYFYPFVCCCYRYHTIGTYQGNWYLGSLAEISMILAYKTEINQRLTEINNLYPNDCIRPLINNAKYYSLTEYFNSKYNKHGFYMIKPEDGSITAILNNASTGIALAMLKY